MKTYTLIAEIKDSKGETIDGLVVEGLTHKEFNELKFDLVDLYRGKNVCIGIDAIKEKL